MKAIIHQFDPQIYPRLIWVVIGEKSASAISDRFENITDMDDTSAADTQSTYDITNKRGGVLIRFATKANAQNIQYVCHESTHAAMEIFDYICGRIDCSNQEPFCYLVGWISECIKEALNYRTKKV